MSISKLVLQAKRMLVVSFIMKFNQRLKLARKHAKLTQQQLADALGRDENDQPIMSQANVSGLETDPNAKGSIFTPQLAAACGVDPLWLATGTGDMLKALEDKSQLNYDIKRVVETMAAMEPAEQYKVRKMIEVLGGPASNEVEPNGDKGSGKRHA
jgi:transcriptional regulator with XRE-family HTH domain